MQVMHRRAYRGMHFRNGTPMRRMCVYRDEPAALIQEEAPEPLAPPPPPAPAPFEPMGLDHSSPPGSTRPGMLLPDDMLRIILNLVLQCAPLGARRAPLVVIACDA